MSSQAGYRVEKAKPRQEPVSCHLCRTKKLKCDRRTPCANCTARGVTCHGAILGITPTSGPATLSDDKSVLARLQRLEELMGIGISTSSAPPNAAQTSAALAHAVVEEAQTTEYVKLGNTATQDHPVLPGLAEDIMFYIAPSGVPFRAADMPQSSTCIFLPPKEEAECLFDLYAEQVDHFQHLCHIPSTRAMLDRVYDLLDQNASVEYGHVALILAIFASITFNWTPNDAQSLLSLRTDDSSQIAAYWIKAALDVIDHSRRIGTGSLEDVQAMTILFFLLYNAEGFSSRAREGGNSAIALARELGLHRIDRSDSTSTAKRAADGPIVTEIKRRNWWYLVASDWAMSFMPGPQEGIYTIQPRHMRVNKPRNIHDGDLEREGPSFERPLSEPTPMSYFIQRIKLAEICRDVTDVMPLGSFAEGTSYQSIVALDAKFQAYFNELPVFFRLDERSRQESSQVDQDWPQVAIHRYVIGFLTHTRRCALHQGFLIRGLNRPYDKSRKACLESARAVLDARRLLDRDKMPTASVFGRQFGAAHHVFMATVVLVMDFCYNRVEGQEEQRRGELFDACKMLESAKEQVASAGKLLDALLDVLRKHNVALPDAYSGAPNSRTRSRTSHNDWASGWGKGNGSFPQRDMNVESTLEEIWRQYIEPGASFEMPGWDFGNEQLHQQMF